jgi:hypothetical protein
VLQSDLMLRLSFDVVEPLVMIACATIPYCPLTQSELTELYDTGSTGHTQAHTTNTTLDEGRHEQHADDGAACLRVVVD